MKNTQNFYLKNKKSVNTQISALIPIWKSLKGTPDVGGTLRTSGTFWRKIYLLSSFRQTLSAASGMLEPWIFFSKAAMSSPSSSSSSSSRLNCRPGNTPPLRPEKTWNAPQKQVTMKLWTQTRTGCLVLGKTVKCLEPSSHDLDSASGSSAAAGVLQSVGSTWAGPSENAPPDWWHPEPSAQTERPQNIFI